MEQGVNSNEWHGNAKIFRTYLKGGGKDGKRSVEKHKGLGNIRTFDDAAQFPSFGAVLSDGWVDISFDDAEMSKTFLAIAEDQQWHCMVLENKNNGHIHTYWKDTEHKIQKFRRDQRLACGLLADIHGGDTYIPLRCLGSDRFPPVYDISPDKEYQEVPDELLPVQTNYNLWQMDAGGRNNDLYGYILVLQSQLQLDDDRIRTMYKAVINPYILKDPLEDAELDIILRDESFDKIEHPSFWNGATFQHDLFAEYLMQQNHVVILDGRLHIYKDGIYVSARREIESQMIQLVPKLKKTQRREVLDYLELIAEPVTSADPRYIAFKNGILDVPTGKMMDFTPELVITNKIPWNYRPEAYDALCDKTLNRIACNDPSIRAILEECVGACMYRSALVGGGKAFILTGDRANGKSTFLDMIKAMLGKENFSVLDLKEIGDRFNTSMIYNKLCNAGDDISDDFLQGTQVSTFKKIVTGNRIKAEDKGQDPYDFEPYCKLIFSANDIPRMRDKTGAVMRRLVIIPFNARFSKEDPDYDPFIKYKLITEEAIEYLIRCGIEGLKRVLINEEYSNSEKVQEQMDEYEQENNPIIGFIQEQGLGNIIHHQTDHVFRMYQVFCQDSQIQPMSKFVFSKQINKRLHLKVVQRKIDGKNHRVFEQE